MADDKESEGLKAFDGIKGLVPEIYYDMIARVAAGVPLVALMFSPSMDQLEKVSNAAAFALLIGLGFIAGHLLAAISIGLNAVFWNPLVVGAFKKANRLTHDFKSKWAISILDAVYQRIDWASRKDASAGALLKKMEAGAALSDNLLSGWLVIIAYHCFGGKMPWLDFIKLNGVTDWIIFSSISLLLIVSLYSRRWAFIVRQDRIFNSLVDPLSQAIPE